MTIHKIAFILTLLVGIIGLGGAYAQAQTETLYFCTNNGSWGTLTGNWFTSYDSGTDTCSGQATHLPDNDDHVVIVQNRTCNCSLIGADAGDLDVRSGATINLITSGLNNGSITITGFSDTTSDIDGNILIQSGNSALNFTQNDHIIQGGGSIKGEVAGGKITVPANNILTNETTIEGILAITQIGTVFTFEFINNGTVLANASGTLAVNCDFVTAGSLGEFKVSAAGATLQIDLIDTPTETMASKFTVQSGTLDVEDPGFETSGVLTFTGGTVDCSALTSTNTAKFTGS